MKTSTLTWIIIVLIVLVGGWFAFESLNRAEPVATGPTPSGALGVNGSPNQGNLGAPDNGSGQVQQPSGTDTDGTTVGENLILGINTDAKLGTYLSAFNGMTVYTYAKDKVGTTTCYGQCASNWPPYTVPSVDDIHVPATITGNVGTVTRADGTLQVTYNGKPLYFWKNDIKPNDTTGQGVGGVWFVAKP